MRPFTMIYVRRADGKYLMLKRRGEASIMGGKTIAPGGKIEPDETPEQAALRELHEETGLRAQRAVHRGTYTYISNTSTKNPAGTIHLFVIEDFEGEERASDREGDLVWMSLEEYLNDPTVDEDHAELMKEIDGTHDTVTAFAEWCDRKLVQWAISTQYYEQRRGQDHAR